MAVKPKENRTSLKQTFRHFTSIPFYLRDLNLDMELANEWQEFLLNGRGKGFGSRSYAWALFYTKYYWHEEQKKWIERSVNKVVVGEQKEQLFKRVLEIIATGRDKQYPNFAAFVDDMICDLIKLRGGVCDVENGMKSHANKPMPLKVSDLVPNANKEGLSNLEIEIAEEVVIDALREQPMIIDGGKNEKENKKERK